MHRGDLAKPELLTRPQAKADSGLCPAQSRSPEERKARIAPPETSVMARSKTGALQIAVGSAVRAVCFPAI
jgi:hypothetical protein